MEKEDGKLIKQRTHRISTGLLMQVEKEAGKSGNGVNGEVNSLIMDGLRFREAQIVIHLKEE